MAWNENTPVLTQSSWKISQGTQSTIFSNFREVVQIVIFSQLAQVVVWGMFCSNVCEVSEFWKQLLGFKFQLKFKLQNFSLSVKGG